MKTAYGIMVSDCNRDYITEAVAVLEYQGDEAPKISNYYDVILSHLTEE